MLSAFTKPKTDEQRAQDHITLVGVFRRELWERYETGELSFADIHAYSFDQDVSVAFRAAAHDLLDTFDRI